MSGNQGAQLDEWRSRERPVAEDMRFQLRMWTIQRWGWWLVAGLVAAALLGLFSVGPLSRTTTRAAGLEIEHQRLFRNGASTDMVLRLLPGGPGEAQILLSRDLLQSFSVESMLPEPVRSAASGDGLHLVFARAGDGAAEVHASLRPKAVGPASGRIGLAGEPPAILRAFIYP